MPKLFLPDSNSTLIRLTEEQIPLFERVLQGAAPQIRNVNYMQTEEDKLKGEVQCFVKMVINYEDLIREG